MILSVSVKLSVFVVVVCFVCVCVCVCVCLGTKLIKSHNNVSCPDYLCLCFLFLFYFVLSGAFCVKTLTNIKT